LIYFYDISFWEEGQSPVGGDCYHTILNPIFKIEFYIYHLLKAGAMAIAPYGFFNLKAHVGCSQGTTPYEALFYADFVSWCVGKQHPTRFFNVKIIKSDRILKCQI